jgi:DNA-binding NtrC family response regulator
VPSRVLIAEDQPAVAEALRVLMEIHEIPCVVAAEPSAAVAIAERETLGLVIQDMNFTPGATSGEEGIALFRTLRQRDPELPVLIVTGWTSLETAVQLTREGAADYIPKPWDDQKLVASVRNLLQIRGLQLENRRLREERTQAREELARRHDLCGAVYASQVMHELFTLAVRVSRAEVPVLITGPSGAGKEKLAEVIHANSPRAAGPLVKVNAGAIPDDLLESELFGAEPGAYTDLKKRRVGRFEAAHKGTLFLDEIGNLSAGGQIKLLRVLQSGQFERLGSSQTIAVDARIVAATNADLPALIAAGRFREDLFFRLNVIELAVPPLSARPDDIVPLAERTVEELISAAGETPRALTEPARRALRAHAWPGNVRELRNRIQRALLVAAGPMITPADLGLAEGGGPERSGAAEEPGLRPALGPDDETERARIEAVLRAAGGVVARAAEQLGLSRQALYRKMDRLGISMERRPKG